MTRTLPQAGEAVTEPAGASAQLVGNRFLFVVGPPRSGTTAVTRLLNADDRFAIGIERFKLVRHEVAPGHFTADHFFSPTTGETRPHLLLPDMYQQLRRRWERRGQLEFVGDKYPLYALMMGHLAERFPGCHIVYVHRDPAEVARSAQAFAADNPGSMPPRPSAGESVEVWNECARALRRLIESGHADRHGAKVLVVGYRDLLDGSPAAHEALYASLGLPVTARAAGALGRFSAEWSRREDQRGGFGGVAEAVSMIDHGALAWVQSKLGEPA